MNDMGKMAEYEINSSKLKFFSVKTGRKNLNFKKKKPSQ